MPIGGTVNTTWGFHAAHCEPYVVYPWSNIQKVAIQTKIKLFFTSQEIQNEMLTTYYFSIDFDN